MTLTEGTRLRRSPRALWRDVGPDVLLVAPPAVTVHELSGGASAAWRAIGSPLRLSELVDRLATEHGVGSDRIHDEVERCVEHLIGLGAAEVIDEADD